jgi:hypothetical protein
MKRLLKTTMLSNVTLRVWLLADEVSTMPAKITRRLLGCAVGASLVLTSCQTVQTTRGGVVGVDRQQQMSVFTPSAAQVAATSR